MKVVSQFLVTCGLLSLTLGYAAEPFHIYAPSSNAKSLWVIRAEPSGSGLVLEERQQVDLGFAGRSITRHPDLPLLYIAASGGNGAGADGAAVVLAEDGAYASHEPFRFAHGYSYLSLDRNERFLLGVNYREGQVDVYQLDPAGRPTERVEALDEGLRNAHAVLPSPDNRFVYIPYVKESNALYQYAFDGDTGQLTALDPRDAEPPAGTGPRHIAYHPTSPRVYFSNEQHLGVTVFAIKTDGTLDLLQRCDAIPPRQRVSSSDIVITPDGGHLFAGIRGNDEVAHSVARYRVLADGRVEFLGLTPSDPVPWGMALSPDGTFLIVTAAQGATLQVYAIGADGDLDRVARMEWDERITDVVTR